MLDRERAPKQHWIFTRPGALELGRLCGHIHRGLHACLRIVSMKELKQGDNHG
jgi:hypothetical protein